MVLDGIRINGNIDSDSGTSIGGLVGRAENATLQVSDITFSASVAGQHKVGGLIGSISGGEARIYNVDTPDYHFFVEGYDGVGGIAGSVENASLTVQSSSLRHVVSKEDADVRTVSTIGGGSTGGIVGIVDGASAALCLEDVSVDCPVGGMGKVGERVGGLIGSISCGKDVVLNKCHVTSIVSGRKEVGGYAGHLYISGSGMLKVLGGSSYNYIVPDNSAAGIQGETSVGGVFGYFEAATNILAKGIRVGVNIEGTGEQVGGVIGKMNNSTISLGSFDMTSTTMQVTGGTRVGGMVGLAISSTVRGDTQFDYAMSGGKAIIPKESDFCPVFQGIVKGHSDVGGILGRGENISLIGITSACTVISLGGDNIGGIAGSIVSRGQSDRLEDLVNKSMVTAPAVSQIGGIAGNITCDDYILIHDCINYGSIDGGNGSAGIIGYFKLNDSSVTEARFKPAEIKWCVNMGEVSGTLCTGGIVGRADVGWAGSSTDMAHATHLNITDCGNHGKITSNSCNSNASGVGGIIGYGEMMILLQYNSNSGYILSTAPHKAVGGIAGSIGKDATKGWDMGRLRNVWVERCINAGTIDSQDKSTHVGGVVGFMEEGPYAYVSDCMNSGHILNNSGTFYRGHLTFVLSLIDWA